MIPPDAITVDPLEVLGLRRPPWMADAACNGAGVDFFDETTAGIERARALCAGCAVVEECRDYARGEKWGVWAGEYRGPRKRLTVSRRVA